MNPRHRFVLMISVAMVAAWAISVGGFAIARANRATPERIARYLKSHPLAGLSTTERQKVLREVARLFERLSAEDRRNARMNPAFTRWFQQLENGEKGEFLELTVPSGFAQMLTAFEQMPEDQRRRAIADSVRRLQESRDRMDAEGSRADSTDTNRPPELSPELREKVVTLGLKSFYESGSPDLKAELAPVVSELQRVMESGRGFRMRRRPSE